jgi:hypothetical protein
MEIGKLRRSSYLQVQRSSLGSTEEKQDEMLQSRQSASCWDFKKYLVSHDVRNVSTT